jgi:hypothetical protein
MGALGVIIVLLILVITWLSYRKWMMPSHLRIKNLLNNRMYLVDKTGAGSGASYYMKVEFTSPTKATYTQFGANKEFELSSELEWSQVGETLRLGQMKISLVPGGLMPPTLKLTNDADATGSWTATLREVSAVVKK